MHPNINGSAPVKFVFANLLPRFVNYRVALNGVQSRSLAGFKPSDKSHAGIPHYILDTIWITNETRLDSRTSEDGSLAFPTGLIANCGLDSDK